MMNFSLNIISLILFLAPTLQAQTSVSVIEFGAKGNDKLDDSKAFQKAIDFAAANHKTVYIPKGNYYIANVKLKSNLVITGEGNDSKIHKIFKGIYALGCNFSYPDIADPNGIKNVKNISISNLWFVGTSHIDGFSEHKHLINLNGVENISIRNCHFTAFNGDAIYVGSGVEVEKHNKNVLISNNKFDGINMKNRNAISIIDGDEITIDSNFFSNCSRADMPGAIDIEPDKNPYHIIRNISITNNDLCNIGGNVAAITVFIPISQKAFTVPVTGIKIENNSLVHVGNGIGVFQRNEASAQSVSQNIRIQKNTITDASGFPLGMYGLSNVTVVENSFNQFKTNAFLGLPPAKFNMYNVRFTRNTFSGNDHDGVAISLRAVEDFISLENTFENIGLANGKYGIAILGETKGKTRGIQSIRDVVVGNKTTSFSEENPGHETLPDLNVFEKSSRGDTQPNRFRFKKN